MSKNSVKGNFHIRFKRLSDKKLSELLSAFFAASLSEIAHVYQNDDNKPGAKTTNEE
jgi:hypothetical protein